MEAKSQTPKNIDEYIAACVPDVQEILQKVRMTIRQAAPDAVEKISYAMPCFAQQGYLVYFAAWKNHIGFYPPIKDEKLKRETEMYAGEKGNLMFPLDRPIPYDLISKIVKFRVKENLAKAVTKKQK